MGFNIERVNKPFVVKSPYKPSGDQPKAIEELATRIENGENDVVLMGATGTGKTATTAWLIERLQRPTLIIEPNKTLAAQLCAEFRELMPDNAVSYFVSYYAPVWLSKSSTLMGRERIGVASAAQARSM